MNENFVKQRIFIFRNVQVMLDFDLADIYNVETKALNQAVKRNVERFPEDFMFQLTYNEFNDLQSHIVTANISKRRVPPHAFTQNGIAMLSSVLRSKKAIDMNIQIMRIFVQVKELSSEYSKHITELYKFVREVDQKHETNYSELVGYIQELLDEGDSNGLNKIGFTID